MGSRLAPFAAASAALTLACGPSFQAVYEGDVRFEHCYAVDEARTAQPADKLACWHDWLTTYTYGQTADRVEYAAARYHFLKTDSSPSPVDAVDRPPEAFTARRTIGEPTAPVADSNPPVVRPEPKPVAARPPGAECTDACGQAWRACREGCKDGDCVRCDNRSRACMSACFAEGPSPKRGR